MIKVTVEMWPFGDERRKFLLGDGFIVNDGSGLPSVGNYKFRFTGKSGRKWKEGKVKGFPRNRLLVWDLLYRCLKEVVRERNK